MKNPVVGTDTGPWAVSSIGEQCNGIAQATERNRHGPLARMPIRLHLAKNYDGSLLVEHFSCPRSSDCRAVSEGKGRRVNNSRGRHFSGR